jgi:hypothetical protein
LIYFKDISKQEEFELHGFTVIDLLNSNEVDKLKEYYFKNKEKHITVKEKMHSTCDTNNLDLIKQTDAFVESVVLGKVRNHIKSFSPLFASVLVKENGEGSETGFHQDPTLVDNDSNYVSANVWIALQDTNTKNGNLCVIKKSHKLTSKMLVVTPKYPTIYEKFREKLSGYSTELPIKAGQAIVLDNKLIHGATANFSDTERLAVIYAIKSEKSPWCFYYNESESNQIEKFHLDKEAFANLIKDKRPMLGKKVETFHYDFPQISYEEFKVFFKQNNKNYILNKLRKWLKIINI